MSNESIYDEKVSDRIRKELKCEDMVEIYSKSKNKWYEGKIRKIVIDGEGEWLEVEYFPNGNNGKKRSKQIQRLSKYIKSYQFTDDMTISANEWELKYILGSTIAKGLEGIIYNTKARGNDNYDMVTKIYKISDGTFDRISKKVFQEFEIFNQLKIINFQNIVMENNKIYLTMEKLNSSGHSLRDMILTNEKKMYDYFISNNEIELKYFILEVAKCAYKIHNYGYIHSDINPANIMKRNNKYGNEWTIIDGGLIRENKSEIDGFIGSVGYASPEMAYYLATLKENYKKKEKKSMKTTTAADVFGLGLIILQIVLKDRVSILTPSEDECMKSKGSIKNYYTFVYNYCRNMILNGQNIIESHLKRLKHENRINNDLIDLITQMLTFAVKERPTMIDVIQNKYFNELIQTIRHPTNDNIKQIKIKKKGNQNEYNVFINE